MYGSLLVLVASIGCASSASIPRDGHHPSIWQTSKFNSLLTFGDSYTDENRLNYFASHNGLAPPPGTLLPESFSTAGGGRTWPRYVVQYTGSDADGDWVPSMTLYNYAVSGAVCSNYITPRYTSTAMLRVCANLSPEPSAQ
jgi:phospholipase/lecithinase/hemolysin